VELVFSHVFDAPPEAVFGLAYDLDAQRSLDPRILKYEVAGGGPVRVGSRLCVAVAVRGRTVTSESEVVALDGEGPVKGAELVEHPGLGLAFRTRSRYVPHAGGTRLELRYRIAPRHVFGALGFVYMWLLGQFHVGREARRWFARMEEALATRRPAGGVAVEAEPRAPAGRDRCPYCREGVAAAEAVACADCVARHHAECWDAHGECSACGGRSRFTEVEETAGRPPRPRAREKG